MRYSENCCQLCAVSLNIARLSTKNEPESAGWGYSSQWYYSKEPSSARCTILSEQSGCENVAHEEAEWLHYPGRGCTFDGGYNGWKIGAEEMKGMRFPRYIVRRPKDMEFDGEGPEYEQESEYFLTSQTTCPPDDFEPGELEHVRYGIDDQGFLPQNYIIMSVFNTGVGVPVHDACWKIFERVCKLRLGKVDLQGFIALWRRQACGLCGFQNMKQEPVIRECRDQRWVHLSGTEYLGANPHDIPGLLLGLSEQYKSHPDGDSVFQTHQPGVGDPVFYQNPTDSFAQLPTELRNMILSHLPSKDIASLRLASRSFRQLPKQLFLRLIQDELPWFWEFEELKQMDDAFWKDFFKDDDPEEEMYQDRANRIKRSREGNFTENVNWLMVYKQLCVLRKVVLGVRNRARIWHLVEEVVERIADLRERLTDPDGYALEAGEYFPAEPTANEVDAGLVKNSIYCPRCIFGQIQRKN